MSIEFLDQVDIKGKKLLVRVDYNVPIKNGRITDDSRIRASLETVKHGLDNGAALILCSHMGKPKGQRVDSLSLEPAAASLSELLGTKVRMAPDVVGEETLSMAGDLETGQVMLLENLRFEPGETANDPEFARKLASMADVFVFDGFAVAHRAHASVVGAADASRACCGGLLLKKEWEYLKTVTENPQRPYVAVSGGAKVSSKIEVLESLLEKVDALIIGGAMANTFLAAQGQDMGGSLVETDLKDSAQSVLDAARARGVKIHLPVDFICARDIEDSQGTVCTPGNIPPESSAFDIGPQTVDAYKTALADARTVVWNGPMGAFENTAFAQGSLEVARAVAGLGDALTVVGGGDTDAMIHSAGLGAKFSFISTGGGAFLEFLEGKELPGFKALKECGSR